MIEHCDSCGDKPPEGLSRVRISDKVSRGSDGLVMAHPFFTIGHSTRSMSEFMVLLADSEIELVVDVRTVPRSRANPQYRSTILAEVLRESGIDYEHVAALGGLRGRIKSVPAEVNSFWKNSSFHNYADYALGEQFQTGLNRLKELGQTRQCVVMCSEAVWWRCHRRIIADYLIAAGESVFHILGRNHIVPASMTPEAEYQSGDTLHYRLAV